jgi:hypothetical protein
VRGLLNTSHQEILGWLHAHGLPTNVPNPVVPMDISNVAAGFFDSDSTPSQLSKEGYPSITLPYRALWFEYRAPAEFKVAKIGTIKTPLGRSQNTGVYAVRWSIPAEERATAIADQWMFEKAKSLIGSPPRFKGMPPEILTDQASFGEPRWLQAYFLWQTPHPSLQPYRQKPICSFWVYVGENGEPFASHGAQSLLYWPLDPIIEAAAQRAKLSLIDYMEMLNAFIHPVYMASSLLACKNVEVIDSPPPPKVLAKREKRHGCQIVYKTLSIQSMRKKTEYTEQGSCVLQPEIPLHMRRGHWKDYRSGKGLFGKYKSLFWWDHHAVSTEENGIIHKDYKVK